VSDGDQKEIVGGNNAESAGQLLERTDNLRERASREKKGLNRPDRREGEIDTIRTPIKTPVKLRDRERRGGRKKGLNVRHLPMLSKNTTETRREKWKNVSVIPLTKYFGNRQRLKGGPHTLWRADYGG